MGDNFVASKLAPSLSMVLFRKTEVEAPAAKAAPCKATSMGEFIAILYYI